MAGIDLEDVGQPLPEHPGRLGAAPQLDLAVLRRRGDAALRLDVALMHRLGVEFTLDDHVGLGEALRDVAHVEIELLDHVRGLARRP